MKISCRKWVLGLYFYSNQSLMVINLQGLDQHESKYIGSQKNAQYNIRQTYDKARYRCMREKYI